MYFVIFILVIVSNTDQTEIDGVDDEYQVEVVRYDHDQDSTFQGPTSDYITQNESTEPGKDLFCILFIFFP